MTLRCAAHGRPGRAGHTLPEGNERTRSMVVRPQGRRDHDSGADEKSVRTAVTVWRRKDAHVAGGPGVASVVRPSLSACDAFTTKTSPAQNFANVT